LRILASLFHPKHWPYSGSERRFCALSREWAEAGLETFALEPTPIAASLMPAGYTPLHVPIKGRSLPSQLASWSLRATERAVEAARHTSFDLVYATNNNIFNVLVAAIVAARLSLPAAVVVRHLRWMDYREGDRGHPANRVDPTRFMGSLGNEGISISGSLLRAVGALAEARILPRFDGYLTVSTAVSEQLKELGLRASVFATGNAIQSRRLGSISSLTRDRAALFVGRLDEGKGALDLIQLWSMVLAKCPGARLDIVGGGTLARRIERETRRLGCTHAVRLHGFRTDHEVEDLRRKSRVFVTLSRTEGFGIAIAEALDAGLPVVAWDIPPLRETFARCPAVVLCQVGNLDEISAAVREILTLPDHRWDEMSHEATKYVGQFSWSDIAAKEFNALTTVLEVSRRSR